MPPEQIALQLEAINNRTLDERTADMFMNELKKHPSQKDHPLVQKQIERFEYELELSNTSWAQEKLSALKAFKERIVVLAGEVGSYKLINAPQYKNAIQMLQGRLVQKGFPPIGTNPTDGIAGDATYKATIAYMLADPKDFQESLNTLYGLNLATDGNIGPQTLGKLREKTGMEITQNDLLGSVIQETAKEKVADHDVLKGKTRDELITEIGKLSQSEKDLERRSTLLLVLGKKIQADYMNVSYNSIENRWEIRENTTGNVVNLSLTQSDLQFLALSTTISDVESVEGVKNNPQISEVFDSVVKKFDINRKDGSDWVHNDMLDDASGYIDEKSENRKIFVGQIEEIMKKLFAENKDSRTNEHTKRDNTIWLQRLSLLQAKFTFAKSFDAEIERQVFDVTSTTAVNQYIAADTNSRPRDIVEGLADGTFVNDILKSGLVVPAVIIGVISIFATLPKWLKYPAWAILGAMVLNGPYQKLAEKWGLDKKIKEALGQNDYTPNQAGNNPNTEPGIIEEWWARVSGVDAQFKYGYAKIRNEYDTFDNGQGKNRFPETNLEKIFSLSSQNARFRNLTVAELEAGKEDPDTLFDSEMRSLMGVGSDELKVYIRFLLKIKDSGDTTVADILSEGKYDIDVKTNVSYVEQNDSFNTEISKLVSKLSGYSIDTKIDGVDITKTPRARVDAVLASTLPTLWLFQSTDTTELDTIITELTKIKTDVVGTADEAIVGDIITAYTKLKVDVSTAESIRNFMDKSETITAPFPGTQSLGAAYNAVSDGLAWVSGMPVSILGKIEGVSVDQVDILIQDGEKLKTDLTGKLTPELQKVLDAEISKLYEKKAFLLANIALVLPNGTQEQREADYAALVALNASIRENPEAYLERIKKLESDVEGLKNPQSHAEGYFEILRQNSRSLTALANIIASTDGGKGTVGQEAKRIFDTVMTSYNTNVSNYATSKTLGSGSEIAILQTTLSGNLSPTELAAAKTKYDALRKELLQEGLMIDARHFLFEYGLTFNGQSTDFIDILGLIEHNFNKLYTQVGYTSSIKLSDTDIKTTFDGLEKMFERKGVDAATGLDVNSLLPLVGYETQTIASLNDVESFKVNAANIQQTINALPEDTAAQQAAKSQAQEKFEARVSEYIAKITAQAQTSKNLDELGMVIVMYETLDGVARGDDSFWQNVDAQKESFADALLKEKLEKTTLGDIAGTPIEEKIQAFLNTHFQYPEIVALVTQDAGLQITNGEIDPHTSLYSLIQVIESIASIPAFTLSTGEAVDAVTTTSIQTGAQTAAQEIVGLFVGNTLEVGKYKLESWMNNLNGILTRIFQ